METEKWDHKKTAAQQFTAQKQVTYGIDGILRDLSSIETNWTLLIVDDIL